MFSKRTQNGPLADNNVEALPLDPIAQLQAQRDDLTQALFNLDGGTIQQWPGVQSFITYIERQFIRIGPTRFESIWRVMGYTLPPTVEDLLRFVSLVVRCCRELPSGLSIDEVAKAVLATVRIPAAAPIEDEECSSIDRQAIFAILAWVTFVVRPSTKISENQLHIVVEKKMESLRSTQSIENAASPFFNLLRGFGCVVPCESSERTKQRGASLLQVSSLDFFYLKTFGKINVRWTYTLDSHLMFEHRSRTLSLFSFPTFCALNILAEQKDGSSFDHILCDDPDISNHDQSYISMYKREVLLSYSLLFRSIKAQKLFRKSEYQKTPSLDGVYDPLLDILCGKPYGRGIESLPPQLWLETWQAPSGGLLEQDVYSIDTDFPILGTRLLELENFNANQKPVRFLDLWRDKRDSIQWYTFWAVIFIGIAALAISIVQMALAAAQLKAT